MDGDLTQALSGGNVNFAEPMVTPPARRRLALAEALQKAQETDPLYGSAKGLRAMAADASPVKGGLTEALARVAAGVASGYLGKKSDEQYQDRQAAYDDTLTKALTGSDPAEAGKILASNPDTAALAQKMKQDQWTAEAKARAEAQALANQPITPYQQAQLDIDRQKLSQSDGGLQITGYDAQGRPLIQMGGRGGAAAPTKMTEQQGQAASRSTMLSSGLDDIEKKLKSPGVNPVRLALSETVDGTALGNLLGQSMLTPDEQVYTSGRDAALEGLASAVTGAGVTKDQFTRFRNMLPSPTDRPEARDAKMDNAYKFLLTQTSIAGPIADEIRNRVVARGGGTPVQTASPVLTPPVNQIPGQAPQVPDQRVFANTAMGGNGQDMLPPPGTPMAARGPATMPGNTTNLQPSGNMPAPKTADEFARLPSGAIFVAPDGTQRVKP